MAQLLDQVLHHAVKLAVRQELAVRAALVPLQGRYSADCLKMGQGPTSLQFRLQTSVSLGGSARVQTLAGLRTALLPLLRLSKVSLVGLLTLQNGAGLDSPFSSLIVSMRMFLAAFTSRSHVVPQRPEDRSSLFRQCSTL